VASRWNAVRNLAFLTVGLVLGLLLSAGLSPIRQEPALSSIRASTVAAGGSGSVDASIPASSKIWTSVQRLEAEQQVLKAQLSQVRRELAERQQAAVANTIQLSELNDEVQRQRLLAGLVPVQGAGVVVTLDDSHAQIPRNVDPNLYLIHEYDLRDLVNLLWIAGSEAIAINDERLVGNSSIYCVGSTVMVNNTRLAPPYRIQAIGNPRVQREVLSNPSYLQSLRQKQRQYGLRLEIETARNLSLPAFDGSFRIQVAQPGE
jgi:uncharacterized protein YlxW (UPF0749 family)